MFNVEVTGAARFYRAASELTAGLGGNASIERRIARTIASLLKRSSILFGVSIFSAKNTEPVGHSTHPTHQPGRCQPFFPLIYKVLHLCFLRGSAPPPSADSPEVF